MAKTIAIAGEVQKKQVADLIRDLPTDSMIPKWAVTIEKYSTVRSRQANALYWVWLSHISKYAIFEYFDREGFKQNRHMTKEELHAWFALKFLEPIWVIDITTGREIPYPRSTKGLNKEKFTNYMYAIREESIDLGIPALPELEE